MGGETHKKMAASSYPKMVARPVGKQIHDIYEERLRMFTNGGQYESASLLSKMYEGRVSGEPSMKLSVYSPPDLSRPTFKDATSKRFEPTRVGESFGPSWSTHWFKIQLTLPLDLKDKEHLELHWNANNEGLVWSEDGIPLQGLTGGGDREEWILPDSFRDGKEHVFYIEMACNGMFGNALGGDTIQPPDPSKYFQLQKAEIVAVNLEARGLFVDFWIIGDAAREFPNDSWQEHQALQICNAIMDCFIAGRGSKECIVDCRKIAQKYLTDKVDSSKVYNGDEDVLITAVGHCHIDTCWLWPWAETKRKVARSWANQCNLMDRYPEHRFTCSQAQQYKWLEQYYPSLFDRVKEKVKDGTFQPIGGSWVEHDTNLPSGESLVRQFVYGQRFFESHFGERCKTFWLPDTFGYSAQIPQLCRLAGMTRFFTQKLSWNNINNFPHTTFNWVSLDGSQVLCHMPPSETYTAEANFGDVKRSVSQHKSLDQDPTSLLIFGKGDGGGGPTWQHLEKLRRCRGVSDQVGLLPRLKVGDSVDDFFARLEKKAEEGTNFTTWYGELYFELHRGTYTSQANNKRNNRKAEILVHDVEYFATLASVQGLIKEDYSHIRRNCIRQSGEIKSKPYKYPKKEIDEIWEAILLCQFHDCLPGSSIEMCYDDSDKLYAKIFGIGEKLIEEAMSTLGFSTFASGKGDLVAINTGRIPRCDIVKIPKSNDYALISGAKTCRVEVLGVPGRRYRSGDDAHVKETEPGVFQLSNGQYNVVITDGVITSLYHKYGDRELIPPGKKANQLVIFDDKPLYWQAWDVEVYHLDTREELKPHRTTIVENSPHRVAVQIETKISEKSWAKTIVSLTSSEQVEIYEESTRTSYIDISSEIEWHETFKFLKVEFPLHVHATEASYETQFGLVKRPTHYNTSWDMAKFEVCCHKWADLSESTLGVSIFNDSKYGFATVGNVMRLSLLRAPKAPDAHADMGRHHIRYGIFPHDGPLSYRTVHAAYNFNNPIVTPHSFDDKTTFPFFKESNAYPYLARHNSRETAWELSGAIRLERGTDLPFENLVIDTIKRGDDDEDVATGDLPAKLRIGKNTGKSIIVRIYESTGGRSKARLVWRPLPVHKVTRVSLLEDDEEELELTKLNGSGTKPQYSGVMLDVGAFEVLSLRLWLED